MKEPQKKLTPKKPIRKTTVKLTKHHASKLTKALPELHCKFSKALADAGFKNLKVKSFTVTGMPDDSGLDNDPTVSPSGCKLAPDGKSMICKK